MSVDPAIWESPPMRAALCVRDIGGVYGLLQRAGVAQRRIAALTGQSQSDVSEILSGRRVISYDLLARIADGLGVPRGYLGLAYDHTSELLLSAGLTERLHRLRHPSPGGRPDLLG
ncbi:MAG: helix-turn-helix domain-containing protein [Micromonosporaceae bacterium]